MWVGTHRPGEVSLGAGVGSRDTVYSVCAGTLRLVARTRGYSHYHEDARFNTRALTRARARAHTHAHTGADEFDEQHLIPLRTTEQPECALVMIRLYHMIRL